MREALATSCRIGTDDDLRVRGEVVESGSGTGLGVPVRVNWVKGEVEIVVEKGGEGCDVGRWPDALLL